MQTTVWRTSTLHKMHQNCRYTVWYDTIIALVESQALLSKGFQLCVHVRTYVHGTVQSPSLLLLRSCVRPSLATVGACCWLSVHKQMSHKNLYVLGGVNITQFLPLEVFANVSACGSAPERDHLASWAQAKLRVHALSYMEVWQGLSQGHKRMVSEPHPADSCCCMSHWLWSDRDVRHR